MKSRVMFLGYYMFLLSGTIKEEILPTHLEYRSKIPMELREYEPTTPLPLFSSKFNRCPKRVGSFGYSTLASEEKASEK